MSVRLSFSTINSVINCPHSWLTKQMGLPQVQSDFLTQGKEVHRVIQDHISGKDEKPLLKELNLPIFPIVEEKDFDERLKIEFNFNKSYQLMGFADGRTDDWKRIVEIKSSSKPWNQSRFAKSPQWKIYGLMKPEIETVTLITTPRDIESWGAKNIKVFNADITDQHRKEARSFIEKGIGIIETIKDQKLHEEEPNRYCWTVNCPFCGGNPQ